MSIKNCFMAVVVSWLVLRQKNSRGHIVSIPSLASYNSHGTEQSLFLLRTLTEPLKSERPYKHLTNSYIKLSLRYWAIICTFK